MKTLAARLKIEKFVKEQLWQHVFVVSMIALFALSGVAVKETRDFFKRHKEGKIK